MRVVKKPAERRQELAAIAARLFFEKGYEKTSVRDIYTEANGSFGMFYHHFKSKEEIFTAAMSGFTDRFVEKLAGILSNRKVPYTVRYRSAIAHWHAFLVKRDKVSDFERDVPVFRNLSARILGASVEPLRLYLEEGAEEGLLEIGDSRETAIFLLYGIYGLMKEERLLLASNENAPEVFKSMEKLIARLLNADEAFFTV